MKAYDKDGDGGGSSKDIVDSFLRHQIYLSRFSTYEARKLIAILDNANSLIKQRILKAKSIDTKARYWIIAREIRKIMNEAVETLDRQLELDFTGLADEEIQFVEKTLSQFTVKADFALPAPKQVWAAASFGPYAGADGKFTFQKYMDSLGDDAFNIWDIACRSAYLTGMPAKSIVKSVLGTINTDGMEPGQVQKLRKSLEMNTKTAISFMANEARNAVYKENAGLFDYYIRLETLDSSTCLACGVEDLKHYPDLESAPTLPAHINCILGDTCISTIKGISNIFRRVYEGEIIVITTASGNILRCTPNHPILCDSGFIPAKFIKQGNNLVINNGLKIIGLGHKNKDNKIARIEDIFSSFLKSCKMRSRKVPTSPEDFHGDVTNQEIEIVSPARVLPFIRYAFLLKIIGKESFIGRTLSYFSLISANGSLRLFFKRLGSSFCRKMGIVGKALYFFFGGIFHSLNLLFARIPLLNSVFIKKRFHISPTKSEPLSNSSDANTPIVKRKHFANIRLLFESMNRRNNSVFMKNLPDGFMIDRKTGSNILNRYKRLIKIDNVLSVNVIQFCGYVYNLQTKNNWYIANNVIIHNCRGLYLPHVRGMPEYLEGDERASVDGPVPASLKYPEWLSQQPESVQKEILGSSRFLAYKNGMPISSFVSNGSTLNLRQLMEKEGLEFFGGGLKTGSWQARKAYSDTYYESIRNRNDPTDIIRIAENSGFSRENIKSIRDHVFIKEHDLGEGVTGRFATDWQIAQAWQRMEQGWAGSGQSKYHDVDLLLLRHELEELTIMAKYGYNAFDAHEKAEEKFQWDVKMKEFD